MDGACPLTRPPLLARNRRVLAICWDPTEGSCSSADRRSRYVPAVTTSAVDKDRARGNSAGTANAGTEAGICDSTAVVGRPVSFDLLLESTLTALAGSSLGALREWSASPDLGSCCWEICAGYFEGRNDSPTTCGRLLPLPSSALAGPMGGDHHRADRLPGGACLHRCLSPVFRLRTTQPYEGHSAVDRDARCSLIRRSGLIVSVDAATRPHATLVGAGCWMCRSPSARFLNQARVVSSLGAIVVAISLYSCSADASRAFPARGCDNPTAQPMRRRVAARIASPSAWPRPSGRAGACSRHTVSRPSSGGVVIIMYAGVGPWVGSILGRSGAAHLRLRAAILALHCRAIAERAISWSSC